MEPPPRDPRLILDVARDRLHRQISGSDGLSAQVGVFFGIGLTETGILVAILALKSRSDWWFIAAASLAAACYVSVAVTSFVTFRLRGWADGPSVDEVATDWAVSSDHDVALRLAKTLKSAQTQNKTVYGQKVRAYRATLAGLFVETAALVGLGVSLALGHPL